MNQKIFIIEDDEDYLEYLGDVARKMGFEALCFTSAEDFLEAVKPSDRGCIVSDIRLPGVSGLELLDLVRGRGIEIPYIIISGYATVQRSVDAMKSGAFYMLEKPFDESKLWDLVKVALLDEEKNNKAKEIAEQYQQNLNKLSPGEREVMQRMMQGVANKNMAFELNVSLRTIEARRRKVFDKMNMGSLAQLITYSITATNRIEFYPEQLLKA